MVKIIFFDTETTGLPKNKKINALESSNNWPDLVSICWMVFENDTFIRKEYHIIRPNGFIIPEVVIAIHKITNEIALSEGKPLSDVLSLFKYDIEDAYLIVAHNLHFDKNVIFHAFKWRLGIDPTPFWSKDSEFCSAKESKDEVKIFVSLFSKPNKPYYKFPKLDELYYDTFKSPAPDNAHNADRDVDVLQKIFFKRWNVLS